MPDYLSRPNTRDHAHSKDQGLVSDRCDSIETVSDVFIVEGLRRIALLQGLAGSAASSGPTARNERYRTTGGGSANVNLRLAVPTGTPPTGKRHVELRPSPWL